MTLVLTALTQHEVIQVSDRRFTYLSGGSVVRRDDEKNKAVLFCGRLMFGFTGLGELGMERQTDMWLAGRICDVIAEHDRPGDQGSVLHGVASKATELFRKPRYRGHRHAFVGAGWARFNPQDPEAPARLDEFQPYLAVVSNFHDEERELANPASEFSLQTRILGKDEGVFIFDAPHHLSESEREHLKADLLEAGSARDLQALVSILGGTVRGVAARDDGVGQGLMINCLPRATLGTTELMVVASEPLADAQTFLYVPPSDDTTIRLGPVSTCGGTIMSGFQAGPIPPGTPPTPIPSEAGLPDDPPGLVRRWYLVPIAGSGIGDDPYHAETLRRSGSAVIPSHGEGHPRHGHPKHDVALVLVSSDDHGPLVALLRRFDRKLVARGEWGRISTVEVVVRPPEVFVRPLAHEEAVALKRRAKQAKHFATRERAAILLASNVGNSVPRIAAMWMTDEHHVRRVIHDFNERGMASLDLDYRGGRPRRITTEDRRAAVTVAGARPDAQGVPLTRWSLPRLADHLTAQGIVQISPAHLGRVLADAGLSFQRTRTWKASPDPDYEPKAARILELKSGPPPDGGHVVAFDQMGPISLRPTAGAGWAVRKRPERQRATYSKLQGTRYVFGAIDLHEDRLRVRLRPRRRGRDNLAFMAQIRGAIPARRRIYWIQDCLSANWTPDIRSFAATNKIELIPTPTYASYLNPVECHFFPIAEFVVNNADYLDWSAFAWALARHVQHRNGPHRAKRIRLLEARHQIAA